MKIATFDELFAAPPGTIFGRVAGSIYRPNTGLWVKNLSCEANADEDQDRSIQVRSALPIACGAMLGMEYIPMGETDDDHRFLIYEPGDLDRLAAAIGRGPREVTWTTTPSTP